MSGYNGPPIQMQLKVLGAIPLEVLSRAFETFQSIVRPPASQLGRLAFFLRPTRWVAGVAAFAFAVWQWESWLWSYVAAFGGAGRLWESWMVGALAGVVAFQLTTLVLWLVFIQLSSRSERSAWRHFNETLPRGSIDRAAVLFVLHELDQRTRPLPWGRNASWKGRGWDADDFYTSLMATFSLATETEWSGRKSYIDDLPGTDIRWELAQYDQKSNE